MTGIRLITLLLALVALAFAATATPAFAQGEEVIRDCAEDGDLDGDYSQDELDEAYENLPSDIDEYSNCREVIAKAREEGGGSGGDGGAGSTAGPAGGGNSGGGASADEAGGAGNDSDELGARAERSKNGEVPKSSVVGEELSSSGATLASDDDSDGMPLPLILALILAALGAIAAALYLLRDRLPPAMADRLPGPLKPPSHG